MHMVMQHIDFVPIDLLFTIVSAATTTGASVNSFDVMIGWPPFVLICISDIRDGGGHFPRRIGCRLRRRRQLLTRRRDRLRGSIYLADKAPQVIPHASDIPRHAADLIAALHVYPRFGVRPQIKVGEIPKYP